MTYKLLKEHWLIACPSNLLRKKPYACEILSTHLVLFRNKKGIGALLDRCPHRNAPLSKGKIIGNFIQCPYHGWQFDVQGECREIPGLCNRMPSDHHAVTHFDVIEYHGFVWVKLAKSSHEIYKSHTIENSEYHSFIWKTEVNGCHINILENFLDGTHTHFVHQGLIRQEGNRQKVTATISRGLGRVEIKYTGEDKQSGIISKWFERNRKESYGRFILPSIAEIEYCSASGTKLLITAYITPTTNNHNKIYAVISIRKGIFPGKIKQWLIKPFFHKALKQDLNILQLQQENIRHFGTECFISTELDLIKPHIKSLLRGDTKEIKKTVSIML